MVTIQDILAALAGILNGVSQSVMALSFGFALVPSALAYLVGVFGALFFHSAVPISFQADTMILAGRMGRTRQERLTMVCIAGLIMTALGAFGLLDTVINFAGQRVTTAMMCGVCIILAKASFDMMKEDHLVGTISVGVALVVYLLTQELVYTFVLSVLASTVAHQIRIRGKNEEIAINKEHERLKLQKPVFNFQVLRGVLALICITVGGNIAFTEISSSISNTVGNADHVSIYSGLADAVSSMFGGSPISIVLSPTAAAPHPLLAAVLLMGTMALLLGSGVVSKLSKFIPSRAVAGTLFVLGILVSLPGNLQGAFAGATGGETLAGSVAMVVTAMVDPFVGLVVGVILNLLAVPLGLG